MNKAASPEAATKQFCSNFEGYNVESGVAKRQSTAKSFYGQYAGKSFTTTSGLGTKMGTGGPLEDEKDKPKQATSEAQISKWVSEIEPGQLDRYKDEEKSVGGPVGDATISGPSNRTRPIRKDPPKPKQPTPTFDVTHKAPPRRKEIVSPTEPIGGSTAPATTNGILTTGNTDAVIKLMYQVISELETIRKNTGDSSDLLGVLNEKDFGISQTTSPSTMSYRRNGVNMVGAMRPSNAANTRLVTSMVRP